MVDDVLCGAQTWDTDGGGVEVPLLVERGEGVVDFAFRREPSFGEDFLGILQRRVFRLERLFHRSGSFDDEGPDAPAQKVEHPPRPSDVLASDGDEQRGDAEQRAEEDASEEE